MFHVRDFKARVSITIGEWRQWNAVAFLHRLPKARRLSRCLLSRGRTVLTVCNEPYLAPHASYLARSLDRNARGSRLHLHLVNPTAGMIEEVRRLKTECSSTPIDWTFERVAFGGHGQEFEAAYCAAIRLIRAWQLLACGKRAVLALDADTIVRRPLDSLWQEVGAADIAVRTRFDDRRPHLKFALGTLYLGWSAPTLRLLRSVSHRLAERIAAGTLEWFDDQRLLYEAYEAASAAGSGLNLVSLPPGFADWDFDADSVIWAGKGPRKLEAGPYLAARESLKRSCTKGRDIG